MEYNENDLEKVNLNNNPSDPIFKDESEMDLDSLESVLGGNEFIQKSVNNATRDLIDRGMDASIDNVSKELEEMFKEEEISTNISLSNRR